MTDAPQSYDPDERRDTPLALKLKERIRRDGPMSVPDFMSACLHDAEHGYYVCRDVIGHSGDFITAPEISQVFGELIGLWCAVVWQQMGSPERVNLVEIGPGRGTLMSDALRAASKVPGFLAAVRACLIEPSTRLREIQTATLALAPVRVSHLDTGEYPAGPTIFFANEVLDCIPIDQVVFATGADGAAGWFARAVDVDADDKLQFGTGRRFDLPLRWNVSSPKIGDILEGGRTRLKTEGMARAYAETPMAALFIDYGYETHGVGDTLQAVRAHKFEHPLMSPGEADLTAHVNFEQFAEGAARVKLAVDGPTTQAEFLGRLGIIERASKLMGANPARAGEIEAGVMRLMAPNGMGTRFKVIGIRSQGMATLPGF